MVNRDDGAMFESKSGRTRSGKTFLTWGEEIYQIVESWHHKQSTDLLGKILPPLSFDISKRRSAPPYLVLLLFGGR